MKNLIQFLNESLITESDYQSLETLLKEIKTDELDKDQKEIVSFALKNMRGEEVGNFNWESTPEDIYGDDDEDVNDDDNESYIAKTIAEALVNIGNGKTNSIFATEYYIDRNYDQYNMILSRKGTILFQPGKKPIITKELPIKIAKSLYDFYSAWDNSFYTPLGNAFEDLYYVDDDWCEKYGVDDYDFNEHYISPYYVTFYVYPKK